MRAKVTGLRSKTLATDKSEKANAKLAEKHFTEALYA